MTAGTVRARRTLGIAVAIAVSLCWLTPAHASNASALPQLRDNPSTSATRTVARIDVTGDGRKDVVRFRKLSRTKARITVRTPGRALRRIVHGDYLKWYGAAPVNGRKGAELVILSAVGAHTSYHKMLTYRGGKLRLQLTPRDYPVWVVDGAATTAVGFRRYVRDGTARLALRRVINQGGGWEGTARVYAWRGGDWKRIGKHSLHPRTGRQAARYAGWKVRGLPRF